MRIEVVIPEYITHVQLSEKRRIKYHTVESAPKSFFDEKGKLKPRYESIKGKLFDRIERMFVIKNKFAHGTPGYQTIAGNLHMRAAGFVQIKTTNAIQEQVLEAIQPFLMDMVNYDGPVRIRCEIHTTLRHADWDLSNLWIYFKSFEDAIIDKYDKETQVIQSHRLLRNDNVRHITCSGQYEFFPVSNDENRKMVYIIESDERPEIKDHVLYGGTPTTFYDVFQGKGKASDLVTDEDEKFFTISFTKKDKVVPGAVKEAMKKLYWECLRLNVGIFFASKYHLDLVKPFMSTELQKIAVHGDG